MTRHEEVEEAIKRVKAYTEEFGVQRFPVCPWLSNEVVFRRSKEK